MNVTIFEFVALFAGFVGLAGSALGLAGLVRRRQGLAWHLAAFAFCAVLVIGATWTACERWPAAFWGPVFAFSAILLALQAGQFSFGSRMAAGILAAVRGPRLRWCVVLTACPLLALWLGWRLTVACELEIPDFQMELLAERRNTEKESITILTDAGKPIAGYRVLDATQASDGLTDSKLLARWVGKLIQTGPPDPACNCHGWVYSGGNYWLNAASVEAILSDNGYHVVAKPQVGDVITYRDAAGMPTHSGVVRAADAGMILIESKWGAEGCYLHRPEDQPYGQQFAYYRSVRKGHVLAGLKVTGQARGSVSVLAEH